MFRGPQYLKIDQALQAIYACNVIVVEEQGAQRSQAPQLEGSYVGDLITS
jgi:hypothetical protein